MIDLEEVKAAAKNLIPVPGVQRRVRLFPPIKLKTVAGGDIFEIDIVDESCEGQPLFHLTLTGRWYGLGMFSEIVP